MPILKIEILGSFIELNYKEEEKDKLKIIIENFKKRIDELKHLQGKISDKKIMLIAALKAEDKALYSKPVKDLLELNDKINNLHNEKNENQNLNRKASEEIEKIDKKINELNNIILKNNEYSK